MRLVQLPERLLLQTMVDEIGRYEHASVAVLERALGSMVMGIARHHARMADQSPAELYQVAWLAIVRARPTYKGEGPIAHWVCAVARRACLNEVRAARRRRQAVEYLRHELADCLIEPDDSVDPTEVWLNEMPGINMDAVYNAIVALPRRQRTLFLMRIYCGLSVADLAKRFGIAIGTVKATLAAARRGIRRRLEVQRLSMAAHEKTATALESETKPF